MIVLGIIALILFVILLYIFFLYNSLVTDRNLVQEAWSGIDVELKKRYDLVPNLVEIVKGYAGYEKNTLEEVTKLRSQVNNTTSIEEKGKIEEQIGSAIKSIFILSESYPELKASSNFLSLQSDLVKIEEGIANQRRYYNGTVRNFNTRLQVFPAKLLYKLLGFKLEESFQATSEEGQNVKVEV
jgi:LemA protein